MGISYEEWEEIQKLLDAVIKIPYLMIGNDYGSPDSCPYCFAQDEKPHAGDCELDNLKQMAKRLKASIEWEPEDLKYVVKWPKNGIQWKP